MATNLDQELPRGHFPGTVHYINPRFVPTDRDDVLISEFGRLVRWGVVLLSLYVLLVGVNLITDGVRDIGFATVSGVLSHATHPLLAVLAGVLLTFMVQSSTVITTITVAAVGSGFVPLSMAAMLIMGANIGTCFTSQLVAYGFFRAREELHRALSVALSHWYFNIISVTVLFLVEVWLHPLAQSSGWLSTYLVDTAPTRDHVGGYLASLVEPVIATIGSHGLLGRVGSPRLAATLSIGIGALMIMLMIRFVTILLSDLTASSSRQVLLGSATRSERPTPIRSVLAGLGLTLMTQSSSATICASIPFAATGNLCLRKGFGIAVGANLGTTITAVIAALAVPEAHASVAMQAALIHVLINLWGLLAVLAIKPLALAIVWLSDATARVAARHRLLTFALVLGSYTVLPLAVLGVAELI